MAVIINSPGISGGQRVVSLGSSIRFASLLLCSSLASALAGLLIMKLMIGPIYLILGRAAL